MAGPDSEKPTSINPFRPDNVLRIRVLTQPIPPTRLEAVITDIIGTEAIDWTSPTALEEIIQETGNNGRLDRFLTTVATRPSQQGEQALGQFADHIELLSGDMRGLDRNGLQELHLKKQILERFVSHYDLFVTAQLAKPSPMIERLEDIFCEMNIAQADVLDGLTDSPEDLLYYLRFSDARNMQKLLTRKLREDNVRVESELKEVPGNKEKGTIRLSQNFDRPSSQRSLKKLNNSNIDAWDRLKTNWDWEHVRAVLDDFPEIRTSSVKLHVNAAVQDNLLSLDAAGVLLPPGFSLEPSALQAVHGLSWDTANEALDREWFSLYPNLADFLGLVGENTEINPERASLPLSEIMLLSLLHKQDPQQTEALIKTLHERYKVRAKDKGMWLATLACLQSTIPDLTSISGMLEDWDELSENEKAILMDKRPGQIILRKGIVTSTPVTNPAPQGYVIHRSITEEKAQPGKEKGQPVYDSIPSGHLTGPEISAEGYVSLPFFGDLSLPHPDSTHALLEELTHARPLQNLTRLEDDLVTMLEGWSPASQDAIERRTVIFAEPAKGHTKITPYRYGIQAISKNGPDYYFIVDQRFTSGRLEPQQQVCIQGVLDADGLLILNGGEDIDTSLKYYLNQQALKLSTAPMSNDPAPGDILSWWNNQERGNLPPLRAIKSNSTEPTSLYFKTDEGLLPISPKAEKA